MRRIISAVLLLVLVFTSSTQVFAASIELNSGPTTSKVLFTGKIHDKNLRSKLVAENIPVEVINDILNNAYKNKDKDYNVQVTVTEANVTAAPSPENNFETTALPSSTVYYKSYDSKYYSQPVDVLVEGKTATDISEIVITSAGAVFSKLGLFASGFTILEHLRSLWGDDAVSPQSDDYTEVDGSISTRVDRYTYCDINDGRGYRLGLISQKLDNMDLTVETHAFNSDTRTWKNEVVSEFSNKDFVSEGFTNPNSKALENVRLDVSSDERFTFKVGTETLKID